MHVLTGTTHLVQLPSIHTVGVGMPVTQHPLHKSVREELPHTAPALGHDDQVGKMRPALSVRSRLSREPGSVSGTRCRQTDFRWPAAFPPPPPLPGQFRPGFVRQLRRYHAAVRAPSATAHRRMPLRHSLSTPDPPRSFCHGACITRLSTRPTLTSVNAWPTPLRACTHDSEPP